LEVEGSVDRTRWWWGTHGAKEAKKSIPGLLEEFVFKDKGGF
jgi:hypothetical protein